MNKDSYIITSLSLELAFKTEQYHRSVFDKFYSQNYQITKEDRKIIDEYNKLIKECPNFKEILIIFRYYT